MSIIPQLHRATVGAVGRLLEDYESFVSNQPAPYDQMHLLSFDIRDSEDAYQLNVLLPGVKLKDLDLEFEDQHRLNINGHIERDVSSGGGSWWVSEQYIGDFRRTFNFLSAIDQEHTRAQLTDGVLSLTVPKSSSTKHTEKVTGTESGT